VLRSFQGGDLPGVLGKIEEGYFDSLGVNAIWLTPFVEQIHGSVDEGTGKTYGYHGYWTRDWTAVDPALGTRDDLRALVEAAHRHGIRVLMDAVIAEILRHWRKLGQFRRAHVAVGAGAHRRLQAEPYIFSRTLEAAGGGGVDRVLVAMDQGEGAKTIPVFGVFTDGTELQDAYSGARGTVRDGRISLTTAFGLILLSERQRGSGE